MLRKIIKSGREGVNVDWMMMSLFVSRVRQSLGVTASNRFVAPNPNDIVVYRPVAGQPMS
jgi:hypothetical protein